MFQDNVHLHPYSSFKIGGSARHFVAPKTADGIVAALGKKKRETPLFVLGGGTNLLIRDEGFPGLVIKPEIMTLKESRGAVTAGAGVLMSELLNFAIFKSLAGLEWAGGLPGTLGGAIRGNAGCFGGEIKDAVIEVKSLDFSGRAPKMIRRTARQCRFGYRTSIFKERGDKEVIVEAKLRLAPGDRHAIRSSIEQKLEYRRSRHPMEYPNIGSIFKNVDLARMPRAHREAVAHVAKDDPHPVVPTAYLIAEAGLKGVAFGGAMVSPKHPNFIVNVLHARARDVQHLIRLVKARVKERWGVRLEEEIQYV